MATIVRYRRARIVCVSDKAGFAQWIANFVVTQTFPIFANISLGLAYGLYATFAVLSLFFVLKWVPETKGLELEDMKEE